MNQDPYNNQSNHKIKPKKKWKKRLVIISLVLIVLVLVGVLAWYYLAIPILEATYQRGSVDTIQYQTENMAMFYLNQTGDVNVNLLTDLCPAFLGGQQ